MSIEDDIARADEPAYIREAEALARVEELERELTESHATAETLRAELVAQLDGGPYRLLTTFALAVTAMLHALESWLATKSEASAARLTECLREVQQLTALHLTPSAHKPRA